MELEYKNASDAFTELLEHGKDYLSVSFGTERDPRRTTEDVSSNGRKVCLYIFPADSDAVIAEKIGKAFDDRRHPNLYQRLLNIANQEGVIEPYR